MLVVQGLADVPPDAPDATVVHVDGNAVPVGRLRMRATAAYALLHVVLVAVAACCLAPPLAPVMVAAGILTDVALLTFGDMAYARPILPRRQRATWHFCLGIDLAACVVCLSVMVSTPVSAQGQGILVVLGARIVLHVVLALLNPCLTQPCAWLRPGEGGGPGPGPGPGLEAVT